MAATATAPLQAVAGAAQQVHAAQPAGADTPAADPEAASPS